MKKRILYNILNEWRDEDMDDSPIDIDDDIDIEPTSSDMDNEPDLEDDEYIISQNNSHTAECRKMCEQLYIDYLKTIDSKIAEVKEEVNGSIQVLREMVDACVKKTYELASSSNVSEFYDIPENLPELYDLPEYDFDNDANYFEAPAAMEDFDDASEKSPVVKDIFYEICDSKLSDTTFGLNILYYTLIAYIRFKICEKYYLKKEFDTSKYSL